MASWDFSSPLAFWVVPWYLSWFPMRLVFAVRAGFVLHLGPGIAAAKPGCCHLLSENHLVAVLPLCHNRALQTSPSRAPDGSSLLWSSVLLKNLVATQHQNSAVQVEVCHGHVLPLKGRGEHGPKVTDVTH